MTKPMSKEDFLKLVRKQAGDLSYCQADVRKYKLIQQELLQQNPTPDPQFNELENEIVKAFVKAYEAKVRLAEYCSNRLEGK